MADEARRHFTVGEVERLIPTLETLMNRIRAAHAEAGRLRAELERGQRAVMLSGGARLQPEWWRARKLSIDQATRAVRATLSEILATGGVPKDLELGLVDFLGVIDGHEVNLCWRLGERRIGFWHGLDEGYAARKPIPERERGG